MSWLTDLIGSTPPEPFHIKIVVPEHIVHIVSDPSMYDDIICKHNKDKGYFLSPLNKDDLADIWIQGVRQKNGQIKPKWGYRILGHEFWHWLRKLFKSLINPDATYIPEE